LVELLVVIFIISLLTGSVFVSYRSGQQRYEISTSAQQLVANLRLVQNMALSGKKIGSISPAGYGLYSAADQYLLFYNVDENTSYAAGSSVIIQSIKLLPSVSLSPSGNSIYFVPPDPTTYLNDIISGSLTFTLTSGNASKQLTVSSSGLIELD